MARILLLSLSVIASDPRVRRQIQALGQDHEVFAVGFGARPEGVSTFVSIDPAEAHGRAVLVNAAKLALRSYDGYYWHHAQVLALLKAVRQLPGADEFGLVFANDVFTLPAALRLAKGAPVWLDAHEYAPREFEDRWSWRLLLGPFFDAVCQRDLPKVARMTTVCTGIADEYLARYGVRAAVLPNCPDPVELPVQPVRERHIRMIHHGAAIPSRRIESMIDLMRYLDGRFHLDLMLMEQDSTYMALLRRRAQGLDRIRFIPPVPMSEIALRTNGYDIGLFLLPPVNFNYLHALPNKFFEYMQARLAIAIGPSPEMRALVDAYGCGVVSPNFEPQGLAQVLNALTAQDILGMKQGSDRASKRFNADATRAWLRAEVDTMLVGKAPVTKQSRD